MTCFCGIALRRIWPCTFPLLCILLVYTVLMLGPGIKVSAKKKVPFKAPMRLILEGWKTTELSSCEPVTKPEDEFTERDERQAL